MWIIYSVFIAITFAFIHRRGLRKRYAALLSFLGVIIGLVTFLFERGYEERRELLLEQQVNQELSSLRAEIEKIMTRKFMLLHGMTVFIQNNPNYSKEEFDKMADGLLSQATHIINLAAAPDLIVRDVYPIEGNEKVIGLNYMNTPSQRDSALLCKEQNRIIVSGPIELVQGGKALILRAPVWINVKGKRSFWGIVSSPLSIKKIFSEASQRISINGTRWSIKGSDAQGDDGDWVTGSPIDSDEAIRIYMPLPYGSWVLYGEPRIDAEASPISWTWLAAFGLFTLFAYGFSKSHHYQKELFITNQRLQSSENLFKEMFISAPIGIALCDMQGNLLRTNDAYNQIIGYSPEEVLNLTYWQVTPSSYEKQEAEQLENLRKTGHYGPYQKHYIHKSGKLKDVVLIGFTLISDGEEVIWSFVEDVTVRVNANRLLKEEKVKVEIASKAKSDFLSMMSHEIRTPMNGVIGAADLLGYCDLSDNEKEYLNIIKKSSAFMLEILNNILDIAKLEKGSLHMEFLPISIQEQLDQCDTILRPMAEEKSLELHFAVSDELTNKVFCDPTRFNQLIINIGSNAIKFTQEGQVNINAKLEDDMIIVKIDDTGIGMTQEQMDVIFEPFAQADLSTTRNFGGTGLGLSISRSIAEAMGGRISVESIEGQGSSFFLSLPLRWAEDQSETKEELPSRFKGNLLLVEDNESTRVLSKDLLEKMGLTVDTATDGKEALEVYQTDRHKMILMDIQMPVMDGLECIQVLRERGCQCPAVAITSNVFSDDLAQYKKKGFTDSLPKPLDLSKLRRVLAKYFSS